MKCDLFCAIFVERKKPNRGWEMRIKKLTIQNFRGIDQLSLDFDGTQNTTVLVGINGSGKSTILDCLAMMLRLFPSVENDPGRLPLGVKASDMKKGCTQSEIEMSLLIDSEYETWRIKIELPRPWGLLSGGFSGAGPIVQRVLQRRSNIPIAVYYPVNRAVTDIPLDPTEREEDYQVEAYRSALDGGRLGFESFFEWFRNREDLENEQIRQEASHRDRQLEAVRNAIYGMVPGFSGLQVRRSPFLCMIVQKNGDELLIDQLSDGEKCLLAMAGDIARRLAIANPDLENPLLGTGVVLIDEIDLHLHPEWQRKVIPSLEETFAGCQFIVATHSPQVLSRVRPENIFLLEKTTAGVEVSRPTSSYGRDTNRILEEIMGVPERPENIKEELHRYFRLIDEGKLDEAQEVRDSLERQIGADEPEFAKADVLIRAKEIMAR
jgi:predicted ATP-binding protein involved in virulence